MNETIKTFNEKNKNIFLRVFLPEENPRAIIQINHGLAEHSARYRDFASFLCNQGIGVFVHDHPGHGNSVNNEKELGDMNWVDGWDHMLDSIHFINKHIRKNHPQTPVFLMGHSMGSILSRQYNATYPMYFKGMIISGTTHPKLKIILPSLYLVRLLKIFKPASHKNSWLNSVFYSKFNTKIKNPKTQVDWLSSDAEQVDKYIADPLCGFHLSLSFFKNLFRGSKQMLKAETALRVRKNFATLIISGKDDPVGNFGADPTLMFRNYNNQGFFNTKLLLKEGRHELLNEINREEVYSDILQWVNTKLAQDK